MSIIIPLQMHYGFMHQKLAKVVKVHGGIKTLQVNIKTIASMNQLVEYVLNYIKKQLILF